MAGNNGYDVLIKGIRHFLTKAFLRNCSSDSQTGRIARSECPFKVCLFRFDPILALQTIRRLFRLLLVKRLAFHLSATMCRAYHSGRETISFILVSSASVNFQIAASALAFTCSGL